MYILLSSRYGKTIGRLLLLLFESPNPPTHHICLFAMIMRLMLQNGEFVSPEHGIPEVDKRHYTLRQIGHYVLS